MSKTYRNIVIILMAFSLFIIGGCGKEDQSAVQESAIKVDTAIVKNMDIEKYSSYSGRVKGSQEEAVLAKVSRRVTAIHVSEGQAVKQGQLLISLDSANADISVQQAQAALAAAKAGATANEIQRQAALNNYNRMKELHDAGAVSDQALEAAKTQYDALNTGSAEAGVAQAQAGLNLAMNSLRDYEITSPISGIVGRIDVSIGDMTSMQSPVVVINQTGDLEVEVRVSESDISSVQPGTAVKVKIDAVGKEPLTGTVKSVASIAETASRSYPVTVILPNNAASQVKSGMFAQVQLATQHKENVPCIPMSAVLPQNGENIVYVVSDDHHAKAVRVQLGINDGKYTEVTEGLKLEEKVITKGNTLIDETSLLEFADGGTKK